MLRRVFLKLLGVLPLAPAVLAVEPRKRPIFFKMRETNSPRVVNCLVDYHVPRFAPDWGVTFCHISRWCFSPASAMREGYAYFNTRTREVLALKAPYEKGKAPILDECFDIYRMTRDEPFLLLRDDSLRKGDELIVLGRHPIFGAEYDY